MLNSNSCHLLKIDLFIYFYILGLHFCLVCNIYKAWIEYLDVQFEFHLDIIYIVCIQ